MSDTPTLPGSNIPAIPIQGIKFKEDMTQKQVLNLLDSIMLADADESGGVKWATLQAVAELFKTIFSTDEQTEEHIIEPNTSKEIVLAPKNKNALFVNFYLKTVTTTDMGMPDETKEPENICGTIRVLSQNIEDIDYSGKRTSINFETSATEENTVLKITSKPNQRLFFKQHIVSAL